MATDTALRVDQQDLEHLSLLIDRRWALHEAKGWHHPAVELASDTLGVLASAKPSPRLAPKTSPCVPCVPTS